MRIDLRMKPQRPKSASQFWRKTRRTSPLILSWPEPPPFFNLDRCRRKARFRSSPTDGSPSKPKPRGRRRGHRQKKSPQSRPENGFGPALLNLRRPFDSATNPQSFKRDAKSDAQWADRKNNSHDGAQSTAPPNASRINILPLSPGFEQFSLTVSRRANSSLAVKLNLAKPSQAKPSQAKLS